MSRLCVGSGLSPVYVLFCFASSFFISFHIRVRLGLGVGLG